MSFIDSTGLRALLGAHNRATEGGHRFLLVPGPRFVQKVFTVTGLDGVFEFVAAEDLADLGAVGRDAASDIV